MLNLSMQIFKKLRKKISDKINFKTKILFRKFRILFFRDFRKIKIQ